MTIQEYWLELFQQECNEVAQRISKAKIFGLDEVQPGQELSNRERINYEFNDLLAIKVKLQEFGVHLYYDQKLVDAKLTKAEKFLKYAQEIGQVDKE